MHHANLLIGTHDWALSELPLSEQGTGPDILVHHFERMSIANVRTLIYEAGLRPVAREYRTFVLLCDSILHEAQNALLKLFEEPNEHTVFYLVIPREDMLLPTLRSRLHLLSVMEREVPTELFEEFLKRGYADRLKIVGEKLTAEDGVWLTDFLRGLEQYAEKSRDARLLKEVMTLMSYINTTGASKKMLLEHIALTL